MMQVAVIELWVAGLKDANGKSILMDSKEACPRGFSAKLYSTDDKTSEEKRGDR